MQTHSSNGRIQGIATYKMRDKQRLVVTEAAYNSPMCIITRMEFQLSELTHMLFVPSKYSR